VGTTAEKRAEKGMEERRGAPRLCEKLPVKLVVLPQTTPSGELTASSWEAFSADISVSGVVVAVQEAKPDSFYPEGQLRLEIELPEPWGEIRTLGIIRRVKPMKKETNMTLVGIEFEGMAETDSQKLDEFIHGERHV
jgi:c-di-GMP-binding flagellar brake protein YcgR